VIFLFELGFIWSELMPVRSQVNLSLQGARLHCLWLRREHVGVLHNALTFGIGPVGYAGTISAPGKALRQVVSQGDPKLVLTKLLGEATLETQIYALAGLKMLDNSEFKSRLNSCADQTNQVRTIRGCIVSTDPASEVAKAIAAGQYELAPA
jgi:hypothetical protein